MIFKTGDGNDILVDLTGHPEVALLAVGHDITEEVPRISVEHVCIQFVKTGKYL
jgi:hypothetical protein